MVTLCEGSKHLRYQFDEGQSPSVILQGSTTLHTVSKEVTGNGVQVGNLARGSPRMPSGNLTMSQTLQGLSALALQTGLNLD